MTDRHPLTGCLTAHIPLVSAWRHGTTSFWTSGMVLLRMSFQCKQPCSTVLSRSLIYDFQNYCGAFNYSYRSAKFWSFRARIADRRLYGKYITLLFAGYRLISNSDAIIGSQATITFTTHLYALLIILSAKSDTDCVLFAEVSSRTGSSDVRHANFSGGRVD